MRTILVGDVHGCKDELDSLLDRVSFVTGDRLVFVGDLVARGPDSLGVLDIVRTTGALVVRGNHEQKLLSYRTARDAWLRPRPGAAPREPVAPLGKVHLDVARALRPVDWVILESSPFFIDLPEHDVRVVHAGLVPDVPFDAQAPDTLLRIRTVRVKGEPVLWGTQYEGPPHVVFGHNALAGLQVHPWATGLDTGCVYGRALTAMVLAADEPVPRDARARQALLVTIPARRVWFDPAA